MSGTTLVVGAPFENASGTLSAGNAYVFNARSGKLIATLTSPNPQAGGYFGWAVGISGTTVVVGAPNETASGYIGAGHAYQFNAMTGALIRTLTSPNAQVGGAFGEAVATSGATMLIAAYTESARGYVGAGRAYVFSVNTGALISTLTSPNVQTNGNFGTNVAISGTTAMIGAPQERVPGHPEAGRAYAFDAATGALISKVKSPNPQTDGYFGDTVSISGSVAIVGAPGESASGYAGAGHAYMVNATTGALIRTFTSPNAQPTGDFGFWVANSATMVVIGANAENASGQAFGGHAYIFTTTGRLVATLTSPNAQLFGLFGAEIAISGALIVVGADSETASGIPGAGHAYVYNVMCG